MLAVYIGLRALPRQDWAVPIVVREAELGAPSYLPRIAIGQRSRMGLCRIDSVSCIDACLSPLTNRWFIVLSGLLKQHNPLHTRAAGRTILKHAGVLQRVDRRGRLSGVILSIWRIESEQAKRRVGAQSRRRRAIMSEGYKVRGATPRHPSRSAPRAPARPLPRVAARHGPARLQHFPCDVLCPGPPGL